MMRNTVKIIGAGPAGLFAAYELCDKFDVVVFEKRSYVGGSGLHSDGKLNFHPKIGGDITEFVSETEAWNLMDYILSIFKRYGVEINPYDEEKYEKLEVLGAQWGIKYIKIHQAHIGSDYLPLVINDMKKDLESRGVVFELNRDIQHLVPETGAFYLLAPGRIGSEWLIESIKPYAPIKYNPIDIGVRVETSNDVMKKVTDVCWDAKFHIYSDGYDDFLRTFCVCPSGYVVRESYGNGLIGVNGHSMRKQHSNNTNFAFLCRANLTEPIENTTEYGKRIAQLTNTLGGGKPIIQRLGDLRHKRRSTWSRINKSHISPTLTDVVPGDISMAFPQRILQNLIEGLEKLDNIIPGLASNSTLLYAPEIKFYAQKIMTDKNLRVESEYPIYVAGDGAGISRGIVGAAATGIIAARGIIKEAEK